MLRKWANVQTTNENSEWNYFSPELLYLVYGDFFNCCRWQLKTSTENAELRKQVQYLYLGQKSRLDDKDYLKLKPCMTVSNTLFGRWKMLPSREGAQQTEKGSFQGCPVTGTEAMGTKWSTGDSLWISGNTFLLLGWLSTGTGCPGKLQGLHPCRHPKSTWT